MVVLPENRQSVTDVLISYTVLQKETIFVIMTYEFVLTKAIQEITYVKKQPTPSKFRTRSPRLCLLLDGRPRALQRQLLRPRNEKRGRIPHGARYTKALQQCPGHACQTCRARNHSNLRQTTKGSAHAAYEHKRCRRPFNGRWLKKLFYRRIYTAIFL